MVKGYLELSKSEKENLINFLILKNENNSSKEDIINEIESVLYNYGEGVLGYFKDNKVIGVACTILKEAKTLKCSYIYEVIIDEVDTNIEKVLFSLIEKSTKVALKYDGCKVLLGINNDKYNRLMYNRGLKYSYKAFEMDLEDNKLNNNIKLLDLEPLNESNIKDYHKIINESFSDIPHGATTLIEEVEEFLLKQKGGNDRFYLLKHNDKNIGCISTEIINNTGIFDIGLCRDYRGKGLGKSVLETAVKVLMDKKVEKIRLIVVEKNTVALNMYKKRGFKVNKAINYWYEIF